MGSNTPKASKASKASKAPTIPDVMASPKIIFYKRPLFYFLVIAPVAGLFLVIQFAPPISTPSVARPSAPPIVPPIVPPLTPPATIPPISKTTPEQTPTPPPITNTTNLYQRNRPSVFPGAKVGFPKVKEWVQGGPITGYEAGKTYFIELFSTTCSHCQEASPLVVEMARVYQPLGVQFVAISKEDAAPLNTWLALPETKEHVNYPVASDPALTADRMFQYGTFKNSTPRVFLVKDGIVQWFGHPSEADKPLAELAAGTWDPRKIQDEFVLTSQVEQAKDQITAAVTACEKTGDWQPTFDLIDSIVQKIPERTAAFLTQRFTVMIGIGNMPDAGYALGKKLVAEYPTDIATLRSLARTTLNSPFVQKRDLDFAMETALAADVLGNNEDARAAEVVAFAYFSKGDREHAIENQERAIRLQTDPAMLKQYHTSLEKYKTAEPGPIPYQPPHKPPTAPPTAPPTPSTPPAGTAPPATVTVPPVGPHS